MSGDQIAYRDLEPGELYQDDDEWQSDSGRWIRHADVFAGTPHDGDRRSRRPYNITELLRQRDQAGHKYRLAHEALTTEQAAHKVTMANGLQACKERDEAEQALKMTRASLEETRLAREFVIEERNEAERALSEERAAHVQARSDRDRLIVELNECQQQRAELMRLNEDLDHEAETLRLQAALEAARKAPDFAEGVAEVLRRLEIAADAIDYLADVGTHDENGYACGLGAAIAVVKKLQEKRP